MHVDDWCIKASVVRAHFVCLCVYCAIPLERHQIDVVHVGVDLDQ